VAKSKSPTKSDLLDVLDKSVPEHYINPIKEDPRGSYAMFRAFAAEYAKLAQGIERSAQASFYLPSSLQSNEPASSGRKASSIVTIERTIDLNQGMTIAAGAMVIQGPQDRRYVNSVAVEWIPFDVSPSRDVLFEAVAYGYVYNLDHFGDPEGNLTGGVFNPDLAVQNGIDPKISIFNRSQSRAGIEATITPSSITSYISDSGAGDRFFASDVGLYLRIANATNPENVGKVFRIAGFEDPKQESPPLSGLFPRRLIIDDSPARIRLLSAQADDGGAFTNETVAANEESLDDVTLTPAVPVAGDAYYFGSSSPFTSVVVDISQLAEGALLTVEWEYWDGAGYVSIPVLSDSTRVGDVTFAKSGSVDFGDLVAVGWVADAINGVSALHVRARVTGVPALTQTPLGRQVYTLNPDSLIGETGSVSWAMMDFKDLGVELRKVPAFAGGKDDLIRLLGDERGVTQQAQESDEAFRRRASRLESVVSPNAIRNALNRALEPLGFRGEAFDVQSDIDGETFFEGFFADVDFADYYEPGDLFPESKFKLPLSLRETYGFFFLRVPLLGGGDFGAFADDGPSHYIEAEQIYISGFADAGFADGFPVLGNAVYSEIYDTINRIKMDGVGFTFIFDEAMNASGCP